MSRNTKRFLALVLFVCSLQSGINGFCGSVPVSEREQTRQEIDTAAESTIDELSKKQPEFRRQLETSTAYLAFRMSMTKLPLIGRGKGIGVLVDRQTQKRAYIDIKRRDLGFGLGSGNIHGVILIDDQEKIDALRAGEISVRNLGIETAMGSKGASLTGKTPGTQTYFLSEEGGAAVATAIRMGYQSPSLRARDTFSTSETGGIWPCTAAATG